MEDIEDIEDRNPSGTQALSRARRCTSASTETCDGLQGFKGGRGEAQRVTSRGSGATGNQRRLRQPHGLSPFHPPPLSLYDQLMQLASGAWLTQMIHVAAELGVADQLAAGERPVEELAEACGAGADGLFRLLRGLASLGIFQETAPRHFALTPLAELLRSDHPHSMQMVGRLMGDEH